MIFHSLTLLPVALVQSGPSAPSPSPTLEIRARVEAERIEIESDGHVDVTLDAGPDGETRSEIRRSAPTGAERYRDLSLDYRAEVTLAAPDLSDGSEDRASARNETPNTSQGD